MCASSSSPALLPGEFVLDLGVHEGVTGASVDLVERVLQFAVGVSDGEGETYAATVRGYLRTETHWVLQRDEVGARTPSVRLRARRRGRPSVLFAGQSYYHAWYLSRELRKLGWRADVLNWDTAPDSQGFYHGQDYAFSYDPRHPNRGVARHLAFYVRSLPRYDVFHFSNMHGLRFGHPLHGWFAKHFHPYAEIELLRRLGKKIVYSNNGCLDGVSQTSFASWGDRPICLDCPWRNRPGRLQRRAQPRLGP